MAELGLEFRGVVWLVWNPRLKSLHFFYLFIPFEFHLLEPHKQSNESVEGAYPHFGDPGAGFNDNLAYN